MASGINELIDQLDTLIKDAWSLPLSTEKCILDRNNALALLEEIKNQLPAEVTEAKRLISGKAEFIRQTREEVEQMRQEAGDECRRMVEKENVVQEARKRAREIITWLVLASSTLGVERPVSTEKLSTPRNSLSQ